VVIRGIAVLPRKNGRGKVAKRERKHVVVPVTEDGSSGIKRGGSRKNRKEGLRGGGWWVLYSFLYFIGILLLDSRGYDLPRGKNRKVRKYAYTADVRPLGRVRRKDKVQKGTCFR